jgi:hypothetical protein
MSENGTSPVQHAAKNGPAIQVWRLSVRSAMRESATTVRRNVPPDIASALEAL